MIPIFKTSTSADRANSPKSLPMCAHLEQLKNLRLLCTPGNCNGRSMQLFRAAQSAPVKEPIQ